MHTFFAQGQTGSNNPLTEWLTMHTFERAGDASSDGLADKISLNHGVWLPVAGSGTQQWDLIWAPEGDDHLNPHTRGGVGTYEVRVDGAKSEHAATGSGGRHDIGVIEMADHGPTVLFPGGAGYTAPGWSYGTLRSDQGPRQGVMLTAHIQPLRYTDPAFALVNLWCRCWNYDENFNPITPGLSLFTQYTTGNIEVYAPWLFNLGEPSDPAVSYQVRTVVTEDSIMLYFVDQDGNTLDIWPLFPEGDRNAITNLLTQYRVPGAKAVGHIRTYPMFGLAGLSATYAPVLTVFESGPPVPEPCCPPLPQRLDLGCGDGGCGRDFRLVQIGWSDTLKGEDGEYTFPETRLNPVETVKLTVPVGRQTKDYRLTMGSVLWAPLTIAAVEWTGQYFNNTRRVG